MRVTKLTDSPRDRSRLGPVRLNDISPKTTVISPPLQNTVVTTRYTFPKGSSPVQSSPNKTRQDKTRQDSRNPHTHDKKQNSGRSSRKLVEQQQIDRSIDRSQKTNMSGKAASLCFVSNKHIQVLTTMLAAAP